MLTPPELSAEAIIATLRDAYGLRIAAVQFLPIGADIDAAVYRVEADDTSAYFLKLKRRKFAETSVAVPAFLHEQGNPQIMAPLATVDQRLWTSAHGVAWILYPFFEGQNGYHIALSEVQWRTFGQGIRALHETILPDDLSQRVPRESYSPRWRDIVRTFSQRAETAPYDDAIAARFAAFWRTKQQDIDTMLARADQLARTLHERDDTFALCHGDMHPGNVLADAHDDLVIVDWDDVLYAPKEHDLMCLGGGFGAAWDTPDGIAGFYAGYGPAEIDPYALAYYRYERIIADLASYGDQIFGVNGSEEDREQGLEQVMSQFLPDQVVPIAHQTYQRLP